MKKIFKVTVFSILCLFIITGVSFAGSSSYGDTASMAGSSYDAKGWFSGGDAEAKSYSPVIVNYNGYDSAYAYTSQKVDSSANAYGLSFGKQKTEAYGESYQNSGAFVDHENGTFAGGGQESIAGYEARDKNCFYSDSSGMAKTQGMTYVNANRTDDYNSSSSNAMAMTGSLGYGEANCGYKDTYTSGNGSVEHGTYAQKSGAEAWTHGTAEYSYETNGYGNSAGAGMAYTQGSSNVKYHSNGDITANSHSSSFSTNGPTYTNGGTHIITGVDN